MIPLDRRSFCAIAPALLAATAAPRTGRAQGSWPARPLTVIGQALGRKLGIRLE